MLPCLVDERLDLFHDATVISTIADLKDRFGGFRTAHRRQPAAGETPVMGLADSRRVRPRDRLAITV